jgi:hypothetical protein
MTCLPATLLLPFLEIKFAIQFVHPVCSHDAFCMRNCLVSTGYGPTVFPTLRTIANIRTISFFSSF